MVEPFDSIWIVSPSGYPHRVFEEVAEGFHHAAKALGFDARITHGMKPETERPLVFGACLLSGENEAQESIPEQAIIYQLEQVSSGWNNPHYVYGILKNHQVWEFDRAQSVHWKSLGIDSIFCPIGYVPELSRIKPQAEDIDVLFYGSSHPRRIAVLDEMRRLGAKPCWMIAYGEDRDELIARSKIVLNIHYYEQAKFEIARCSYLMANKKCVVSERCEDRDAELRFTGGVVWADHEDLTETCLQLLGDEKQRAETAQRGFDIFSRQTQSDILASVIFQRKCAKGRAPEVSI